MLLRYPGGKAKIYKTVKNIIANNDLSNKTYAEPFSGGFGLGIKLLLNNDCKKFIINDLDIHIYAFWISVFKNTKKLIDKILSVDISINEWHKQKEIYLNTDNFSLLEIGFSTLFLNRTNFSGILTAGPIGGFNQNGKYKLGCRFNKSALIKQIKELSKYKNNIEIYNLDAIKLIEKLKDREDQIFYNFDPPYVNKGAELYLNFYIEKDHNELFRSIKDIKSDWIITYDNVKLIKDLYKDFKQAEFDLTYSVNNLIKKDKNLNKEIMIVSKKLKLL